MGDVVTDPNASMTWQAVGPDSLYTNRSEASRILSSGVRVGVPVAVAAKPMGEGLLSGFPDTGSAWVGPQWTRFQELYADI